MAFIITSCSNNDTINTNQLESKKVTLNIKTEPTTKIGSEPVALSRYVMEIWEDTSCTIPANIFDESGTAINRKTIADGVFTINLDRSKTYTCLFWADNNGEDIYDVTNLQAVQLKLNAKPIEAYSTTLSIDAIVSSRTIILKRAVAKLSFLEKDYIPENSNLKIEYKQNTIFNVLTQKANTEEARTEMFSIPNEINTTSTTPVKLGSFYTLANVNSVDKQTISMTSTLNSETPSNFSNVPVLANHNTNILHEYSKIANRTFSISIDYNWGPDDIGTDFN